MHPHHHHRHHHHHHHVPTIIYEQTPIVQETIVVQSQQQPIFVQKPTTTFLPTPTFTPMYTTPTYSTPTYTTPTYTTPTYTTPTYTMPTQTYTTPTYTTPTMTTMTPTYTTPTYPTTYPTTTTFDPTKHPYFRGALGLATKYFSDQSLLSKYNNDHKIAIINIAHNGKACTGLSAQYYVASQNLTIKGDLHYGTGHAYGGKDECVLLDIDEYIVEIFGKQSKWIDSLGFKTNKGRIVEYGAQTGFFFNVVAPTGYHFAGLAGGIGEFLDYITFEVAPMPVKKTFAPTTTTTMGFQTGGMQQMPTYQTPYKPF